VSVENGEWVMYGLDWDDPDRIKSPDELLDYINTVGFLPLFGNEVDGFSVEEHTAPGAWWTDDEDTDPWAWRILLARSGKVAYGKFFHKKAGFISLDWLPYFINYRRDGYDFDARWDDELATLRQKKLMDLFTEEDALFGYQMKRKAGFGKNGEKNFAGVVTDLQMMTYLCIKDMRCRVNKRGEEYGWPGLRILHARIPVRAGPGDFRIQGRPTGVPAADPDPRQRTLSGRRRTGPAPEYLRIRGTRHDHSNRNAYRHSRLLRRVVAQPPERGLCLRAQPL